MSSKPFSVALLVIGILLLSLAGVRFALSAHGSEFSPPEHGFFVGFHIDRVTFIVGAAGTFLCALHFLWRRRRA